VSTTAKDAIEWLSTEKYDIVFLDHDLGGGAYLESGPGTGYEVAQYIASDSKYNEVPIIIHSWNPVGAENMKKLIPHAAYCPFGTFGFSEK
jgi:DNA-binding response OmpR family regulator